jgi:hypothetical protein
VKFELRPFDPSEQDGWKLEATLEKGNGLDIQYILSGPLSRLKIPQKQETTRRVDGLYQHTCFEAFVAGENGRYLEWNFSPSGDWCLFAFDEYRKATKETLSLESPHFKLSKHQLENGKLTIGVSLDLAAFSDFLGKPSTVGLSAVLEWRGGNKMYWAMKHAGEKPDFHRSESFLGKIA